MNCIRPEIPAEVKTMKEERYETKMFNHEDANLTVYQGKPIKNVLALITMHPYVTVRQRTKKLPETVEYCNSTRYGVDVLDKNYTTKTSS